MTCRKPQNERCGSGQWHWSSIITQELSLDILNYTDKDHIQCFEDCVSICRKLLLAQPTLKVTSVNGKTKTIYIPEVILLEHVQ
jgi:hypothetical protein